jgi:sec-independent protein translocase protein TatA
MGISGGEILLIALVALIFFGSEKLPEVARGLGKVIREFKKASDEIKDELTRSTENIRKDIEEVKDDITKSTKV